MVHHNVCPVCENDTLPPYLRCSDHFLSKEVFIVHKCASCGFEFTQDVPDETVIGKYYESVDYISHSDTSKGFSNKIYRLVRDFMLLRKKNLIEKVTGLQHGSLIDIGSGAGYFANTMKKSGWQVEGIEINDNARNNSASRFGLKVSSPDQISVLEPDSRDCITLWHVLEHFQDPFSYIAEIKRVLKPGGICLIALPNCNSYDAEYYKEFWAAYDVPRHLWHFNPTTFRLFSEKTGLSLEKIGTLPLDVFYISILSEKYRGSKLPFLTGMFRGLWFAACSMFNMKKSSSIIYILRK